MIAALTAAARRGCVVKTGVFFEALAKTELLAIDKTGTLTEGKPRITAVVSFQESSEETALAIAAALSRGSLHPIAQVLSREDKGMALNVEAWREEIGSGVVGTIDGTEYRLGRLDWLNNDAPNADLELRTGTWLANEEALSRQRRRERPSA